MSRWIGMGSLMAGLEGTEGHFPVVSTETSERQICSRGVVSLGEPKLRKWVLERSKIMHKVASPAFYREKVKRNRDQEHCKNHKELFYPPTDGNL